MNEASGQMVRTFYFEEDLGHGDRIISASWAHSNKVPSLGGLVKTHKEELKMRPVCYAKASQCHNGPLTSLLGIALNLFIEAADRDTRTEVESTEELYHAIKQTNDNTNRDEGQKGPFQNNGSLEFSSLDVKNFYPSIHPSIHIDVAAEEVKLEVMESEAEVQGVNYEEAALFLACTMSQEDIDREGLTHAVHRRKKVKGVGLELPVKVLLKVQ